MPLFFLAALRGSLLFYKFHVSIRRVPVDSVFSPNRYLIAILKNPVNNHQQ